MSLIENPDNKDFSPFNPEFRQKFDLSADRLANQLMDISWNAQYPLHQEPRKWKSQQYDPKRNMSYSSMFEYIQGSPVSPSESAFFQYSSRQIGKGGQSLDVSLTRHRVGTVKLMHTATFEREGLGQIVYVDEVTAQGAGRIRKITVQTNDNDHQIRKLTINKSSAENGIPNLFVRFSQNDERLRTISDLNDLNDVGLNIGCGFEDGGRLLLQIGGMLPDEQILKITSGDSFLRPKLTASGKRELVQSIYPTSYEDLKPIHWPGQSTGSFFGTLDSDGTYTPNPKTRGEVEGENEPPNLNPRFRGPFDVGITVLKPN